MYILQSECYTNYYKSNLYVFVKSGGGSTFKPVKWDGTPTDLIFTNFNANLRTGTIEVYYSPHWFIWTEKKTCYLISEVCSSNVADFESYGTFAKLYMHHARA